MKIYHCRLSARSNFFAVHFSLLGLFWLFGCLRSVFSCHCFFRRCVLSIYSLFLNEPDEKFKTLLVDFESLSLVCSTNYTHRDEAELRTNGDRKNECFSLFAYVTSNLKKLQNLQKKIRKLGTELTAH